MLAIALALPWVALIDASQGAGGDLANLFLIPVSMAGNAALLRLAVRLVRGR